MITDSFPTGTGVPHVALSIPGLTGHILGTPGHKPRESQRITTDVFPQLVVGSTSRPGSLQQFDPDRGLLRNTLAMTVMAPPCAEAVRLACCGPTKDCSVPVQMGVK
jgi:hypothetical protein